MENNGEPEAEDPITIEELLKLLAEKTAEVENLKEIAEIENIEPKTKANELANSIAELAKTFSFDVQVKKKHLCICAQLSQHFF